MSDTLDGVYACPKCHYNSLGDRCRVVGCGPRVPWRDSEALYHRRVTADTAPDGWPLLSCKHRAPVLHLPIGHGTVGGLDGGGMAIRPPVGLVWFCAECEGS